MKLSNMEIGARIKLCREEKELTQQNIADELGLNKSTIQRYEAGTIEKIKQPIIEAIAKLLNVNSCWLVGTSEEKTVKSDDYSSTQTEKRLKLLARHLDEIPEENRNKILKNFEDTIDTYLDFMGINKGDNT